MKLKVKLLIIVMLAGTFVFGQNNSSSDSLSSQKGKHIVKYRHSIGASLFMVMNFFPDPADYYLFNYGYQLTQKDRIYVEFNTWKYSEPMGTYGNSEELYPGYVRSSGVGVGYQRFHWKGLFTAVGATPFIKQYYDIDGEKIQKGFQLYLQLIAGYRFEFLKKRLYVEPAYALKYWPIDTNFPANFAEIEEGAPQYIFEYSLIFGFKF
jgi:hypothetical protein